MKKTFKLGICLLLLVCCLSSCCLIPDYANSILDIGLDYLFCTQSYILYRDFYQNYESGMDKQEIADRIGYPEYFIDIYGRRHKDNAPDEEAYEKSAVSDVSVTWHYSCYMYSDPAYPHTLTIYFDSEGRCTSVSFEMIKGG